MDLTTEERGMTDLTGSGYGSMMGFCEFKMNYCCLENVVISCQLRAS